MSTVLSLGAGVQSSYMALNVDVDYYIFADTGDEKVETYHFIDEFLRPKMKEQGKELITVKWWELYNKEEKSMFEYYWSIRGIPTRKYRSCTTRFKILTIRKYLRSQKVEKATMLMGITLDEYHRMKKSDVKWIDNSFPLIDDKLTRNDLYKWWMSNHGFIPPKSGCYYCPFGSRKEFVEYATKHPEAKKVIELELRAIENNPKLILYGNSSLEKTFDRIKREVPLDEWFGEDSCDTGYCFT